MFGSQLKLFRLFGFDIKVDFSWIFIALLIVWSLATGYFPAQHKGLSPNTYWMMAIVGAALFFASIVLHELAHSLVARRYDLKIKGITLFVFGGVAEMEGEPANAKTEFFMAIAGPLASLALAAGFAILAWGAGLAGENLPVTAVFTYLAIINGVIAVFNMLPAFPLDGGRVFRAVMWYRTGDLAKATQMASRLGSIFGGVLMALGIFSFLTGNFIAGLWWVLVGMFVQRAAAAENFHADIVEIFGGRPVSRYMTTDPVVVAPEVTVQQLVDDYFYRYYHDMFPVVENARLLGAVAISNVKQVPRERWQSVHVREILVPVSEENTVDPDSDAEKALGRMSRANNGRMMVARGDRLAGIVTLKDLLTVLSLRSELGRHV